MNPITRLFGQMVASVMEMFGSSSAVGCCRIPGPDGGDVVPGVTRADCRTIANGRPFNWTKGDC